MFIRNIGLIGLIAFGSSISFGDNNVLNGTWKISSISCVSGAEPLVRLDLMQENLVFSFKNGKETVTNNLSASCVATDTADYTIKGNHVFFKNKVVSYGPGCGSTAGTTQDWPAVSNIFSVNGNNLQLRARSKGNFAICPDGDIEVTTLSKVNQTPVSVDSDQPVVETKTAR